MKKRLFPLLFLLICLLQTVCPALAADEEAGPKPPEVQAASAILTDADNERVFFEKNADEKRYPASTTKIMTAFLAIEGLDPAAVLTASETAVDVDRDGSNMGILAGEELTVEQLLYGLLVHSANDAANVLAEGVSGSIESFVELMNAKAAELGMTGTHFANTHGYHDDNHYTTARDLARLASAAMKNETFRTIVATTQYEIPPTNKYQEPRILSNSNALINPMRGSKYLYSHATGIKTGHTSKAGQCLVSSAEKDGLSYICVVLNAPIKENVDYSFQDSIQLFQYGFENFKMQEVANLTDIVSTAKLAWAAGNQEAVLYAKEPTSILLPVDYDKEKLTSQIFLNEGLRAPVVKGETLGTIAWYYENEELGRTELIAGNDVKKSYFQMIFKTAFDILLSPWVLIPLGILCAVIIYLQLKRAQSRKRKRRRRYNSRGRTI